MNIDELKNKITRFDRLSTQKKFTKEEFREMERYLKEIRPNWNGCEYCPAQINFGQTILKSELNKLRYDLSQMETELSSTITDGEVIPTEPNIETTLDFPVDEVIVTSECKRCKKKNKKM